MGIMEGGGRIGNDQRRTGISEGPAPLLDFPLVPVWAMLLCIASGAFAIRTVAIWILGPSTLRFGDAGSYLDTAATLCSEGHYSWASDLPFFRAPGFPSFIVLVTGCHPERIAIVKIALALLDAGTVVLAFLLARGLGMSVKAAFLAGGLVAIHPLFVLSSSDVTSEPLATFLVTSWLVAIVWAGRQGARLQTHLWFIAGIVAGLAALTRPTALLCVPLGIVAVLMGSRRRTRIIVLQASLLVSGAGLMLLPWTLLASRAAGGFVLVNDAGGYALWRGMHPDLAQATRSADAEAFLRESLRFQQETSPRVASEVASRATTLKERSNEWQRLALVNLRADPWSAVRFHVYKARVYWRAWVDRSVSPTWLVLVSACVLVPILIGGSLGLAQLALQRPAEAAFFGLFLVVPWIAQLPFQVVSRFRLPFSEVLFCVLTARLACSILNWRRTEPRSRS